MSIRSFLISSIALAILPPAILHASDTAEYTGGSVKSIPMNSIGFINTDDAKILKFNYGQSVYKLPYEQITGTEITKGDTKHVLKKVPVPALFGRRKETLTIRYKDASGTAGTMEFELAHRYALAVQDSIAEQKAAPKAAANGEWWGDRYWKTNSNKAAWEAPAQTAAQTAPATPATPTTKN